MIGVDIENIKRFKDLNEHMISRVYTKNERFYCQKFDDSSVHLAGMWCAKEAVVKACDGLEISVAEIEILHNQNGRPYVNMSTKLKQYMDQNNFSKIDISISHTDDYAVAVCQIV